MKRRELISLVLIALTATIFSIFISRLVFNPTQKPVQVLEVPKITSNLAQAKTDPAYQAFFNSNALDPTQLIQIGNTKNPAPFSGSP